MCLNLEVFYNILHSYDLHPSEEFPDNSYWYGSSQKTVNATSNGANHTGIWVSSSVKAVINAKNESKYAYKRTQHGVLAKWCFFLSERKLYSLIFLQVFVSFVSTDKCMAVLKWVKCQPCEIQVSDSRWIRKPIPHIQEGIDLFNKKEKLQHRQKLNRKQTFTTQKNGNIWSLKPQRKTISKEFLGKSEVWEIHIQGLIMSELFWI